MAAPPAALWAVLDGIGGRHGWYGVPGAWQLRGALDRLVGGPGRAARHDPDALAVGDPVDWWRVRAREPPRLLSLASTMRLPGTAQLDLAVDVSPTTGEVALVQRLHFRPDGHLGTAYWRLSALAHPVVLGSMARGIAAAARHASG